MIIFNLKCEYLTNPTIAIKFPRFSWNLKSKLKNCFQTSYRIMVSDGNFDIEKNSNVWDSGIVESSDCINIYYGGKELLENRDYYYLVEAWDNYNNHYISEVNNFSTAFFDKVKLGKWISLPNDKCVKANFASDKVGKPSPYFKKTFNIQNIIKRAKIYITSLGIYEFYINGEKGHNNKFSPGWTDYNKSLHYQVYDVRDLLNDGENNINVILGDGWYTGNVAIAGRKQYGDYPLKLNCKLIIEYENGKTEEIISDESWQATNGAIIYSDIQNGEYYDARITTDNWFNVEISKEPTCKVEFVPYPQIEKIDTVFPIEINILNDKYIFNMGQNMVGNTAAIFSGERGTKVTLRYAEMLNSDGSLYTENLRSAEQTDTYILAGEGSEVYEPFFTFHGFQYVEVRVVEGQLFGFGIDSIIGNVYSNNLEETGEFSCSDTIVNKIFKNTVWGQRGNFLSVPTDCPQRDERMGWTADTQIFAPTACYLKDCQAFYNKYVDDMMYAIRDDNSFTDVAPDVVVPNKGGKFLVGSGTPGWAEAGVIIPWLMYEYYGDKEVLFRTYNNITKYIEYLSNRAVNYIQPEIGYGDWLNVDEVTPLNIVATAYYAHAVDLIAKISEVLDKQEENKFYKNLLIQIKEAFINKFVDEKGKIEGDTQTGYLLALSFGLFNDHNKDRFVGYLIDNVNRKNHHLSTGFLGVRFLLPTLSEIGYNDLAYKLAMNTTYPSWGYSIVNGATTLWERWNSYTIEDGFGDVGMNSFNHYCYGSVCEWFFKYVLGINVDSLISERKIILKPYPSEAFSYAKGQYKSYAGLIKVNWYYEDYKFFYLVDIPSNTTAEIILPCVDEKDIADNKDIQVVEKNNGYIKIKCSSGEYNFMTYIK